MKDYFSNWYSEAAEQINYLSAVFYEYRVSLPIAVIVTILIFLTKELLELKRKKKSDSRRLKAIYRLVSLELEENFVAIRMFGGCLLTVKRHYQGDEGGELSVLTLPSKTKSVILTVNGDVVSGNKLPRVHSKVFKKKLEDIAQLDGKNFPAALEALENIKELENIVQSLVDYIGTDDTIWLDGFADYANQILDISCYFLRRYYESIGGEEEDKPLKRSVKY